MGNVSVSQSWVDDMERETQEMFRKLEHQAEQLRQKEETIRALADALDEAELALRFALSHVPGSDPACKAALQNIATCRSKGLMP